MDHERTWKDVVSDALCQLGGEGHLRDIADIARQDPKAKNNQRVEEKVRQVVRAYTLFEPISEGSGRYRLAGSQPLPKTSSTSDVTDEIQGKLLYVGKANDFETFAPADDCTKRRFGGRPLAELVTVRDNLAEIPRLSPGERKTLSRIDVIWFVEREDELRPYCAFEIENATDVVAGLQRLSVVPSLYRTLLFIVGEDQSKRRRFDEFINSQPFKSRASDFHYRYFSQVRDLYHTASRYTEARAFHTEMLQTFGIG